MSISEQEKEELFSEFQLRMAEMTDDQKRLRVAKNNHAMRGVTAYYRNHFDWTNLDVRDDSRIATEDEFGEKYPRYFGLYIAYKKIRQVVPNLVMMKKHKNERHPGYYEAKKSTDYHETPILGDDDIEEATKAGRFLLEAMMQYLESEDKNETY